MSQRFANGYPIPILKEVHENVKGDVAPLQIGFQIHRLKQTLTQNEHPDHTDTLENWVLNLNKKLIRSIKQRLPEATHEELLTFREALDPLDQTERTSNRAIIHEIELRIQETRE